MPPAHQNSEHWHQATFISVIRRVQHPAAALTFAVPNGFLRSKAMRIRAWKEGMVAGVADLVVPVASQGFHGLFIEMKFGDNTLSPEQRWFRDEVQKQGYKHVEARSWLEAAQAWASYLDLEIITD